MTLVELEELLTKHKMSIGDAAQLVEQKSTLGPVSIDPPVKDTPVVTETASLDGKYTNLEYLHKNLSGISFFDGEQKSQSRKFCLRHIFGRKGTRANELENKINFLFLYDTETTKFGDDERKVMWSEVIQKYTYEWADQLHDEQKRGWNISDDNMVLVNGEVMEFGLSAINKGSNANVKALPLEAVKKAKDKSDDTVVILLVDDSVVQSNVKGHFATLNKGKCNINFERTTPKPYHAQVTMGKGDVRVEWGDLMKLRNTEKCPPLMINVRKCQPRKFSYNPNELFSYREGEMLDCVESGDEGQLLDPCHEFKLFTSAVKTTSFIQKFAYEVMRFACGCLNTRKNGTIHFGIADEDPEKAAMYDSIPCQIVGISVSDKDKVQYKDKLTEYINNCFDSENREFARKCISKPQFVSVSSSSANAAKTYVIEIDIEPSNEYTHDKYFRVALPSLSGKKKQQGYKFYTRNGSQTSMLQDMNESHKNDCMRMDKKRLQEEKLGKKFPINMTRQLHNMLGEDLGRLDNSFKRILVLSSMDQSHTPDFLEKSTFLTNVPWSFVIDFNQTTKSETGLCQKLTENTDFEIHDAEEFNDEKLSTAPIPSAWVFGNGMGERSPSLPWGKWQLSERYSGLEELIKKARKEFPQNRTVIMFVIKPGFTKIEAITYGMFLRHFQENSVCFYIEDEQTKSDWMDYVVNHHEFIDEHTLLRRGIVGLPWEEFKQEIENLTMDSHKGMIKIPLNEHMLCPIERGYFNDRSVQIMDSTECNQLYELSDRDHKRYCQEKREKEKQFYSGQEVSMENLWFTENGAKHVLERDIMSRLDACLKYALSRDPDMSQGVETIRLFYSRGSGGTTVARQFLWKLFHQKPQSQYQARCCIINCIKLETVMTIYNYWNYKNESRLPVVVLVDDVPDSDFDYLVKGVSDRISGARSFFNGIAIMFLRVVSSSHPKDEARERDPNMCLSMDCNLSINEHIQFQEKYTDMKKAYGAGFDKFAERTLPSFIMMMQQSKEDKMTYARRIVKSALPDVNENEKDMLTFLSLIQISVPDDSYIYIASFDPIMSSIAFRRERYQLNWANNLNQNAKMFLRFKNLIVSDDAYNETEPGVTILCSECAEVILEWINANYEKKIADIALDFMNSAAFPPLAEVQKTNEFLRCLYYKMYLALQSKKKQTKSGRKREIFSKLISRILQKEKNAPKFNLDKALDVMKLGFEKMDRPVLAQQVARLSYIHGSLIENERENYFEEAEEWIQKALLKRRNSYFLDTAGRIRLRKLQVYFPPEKGTKHHPKLDSRVDCLKAVDLCLDSIKWFQESQRVEQLNPAGYCGEMQAMHYFLSILANSQIFQYDMNNIRKYICVDHWVPKQVPWTDEQERNLKTFRERYSYCLMKVEESKSILKIDDDVEILEFEDRFRDYFVYFNAENQTDDLAKWRQNWMFIQGHIAGGIFRNVFNINFTKNRHARSKENVKDLCSIREKLKENLGLEVEGLLKRKDTLCLIIVKMALYSPFKVPPLPKESAIAEFIETKENMKTLLQMEEKIDGKFMSYCLMFSFMFQWPHNKLQIPYDVNWEQIYHETLEKLETMSNNVQRAYQKPDTDTGEEFSRRQRLEHTPRYLSVATLFYLGNGQGLDMYVHVNELVGETARSRSRTEGKGINWEHPYIGKRLRCLSGERISKGEIEFTVADKKTLTIQVGATWRERFSLEPVSFYVGFSWKGPLAYGVHINK